MNKSTAENRIEIEDIITDAPDNIVEIPSQALNIELKEKSAETIDPPCATDRDKSIDDLIDELPERFPDANQIMKSDIFPLIVEMDAGLQDYYIEIIRKKLSVKKPTIKEALKAVKENTQTIVSQVLEDVKDEIETDPIVLDMALEIANDPILLKNAITDVQKIGVVKERRNIGLTISAINSRLLPGESKHSDTLNVKIFGPKGSGKSNIVFRTTDLFPDDTYIVITSGSELSIIYESDVKHKTLILTEARQLESSYGKDSNYAYILRTLISENFVNHRVTTFIKGVGRKSIPINLIGPTSLITTTTSDNFEPQIDDRLLTTKSEHNSEKTSEVLKMSARRAAGKVGIFEDSKLRAYKYFHGSLQPFKVIIPYSEKISDHLIQYSDWDETINRSFDRVNSLIYSVTIAYQFQRKIDDNGCLIAEYSDYAIAYQLIDKPFRENLGLEQFVNQRIRNIAKNGPMKSKDIAKSFGISGSAVTQWMKPFVKKGILIWVDSDGNKFVDDISLKRAKHSDNAFVMVSGITGLPTPFEITGDPAWDVGGELYDLYDLELDMDEDLLSDDSGNLNTLDDSENGENIQEKDGPKEGVKELRTRSNQEVKDLVRESTRKQSLEDFDPDDPETLKLYEEIGEVFKPYVPQDVNVG